MLVTTKILIAPLGIWQRDRERRRQVKHAKRIERVPLAPNRNLVIYVVGLAVMGEFSKVVEVLDIASHLKVRFGTDVVLGGDLNGIRRKGWREGKD